MPFVTRDGARIHWRSDGDPSRPALLLANSLGADLTLWDPVLPALLRRFRVLRFDLRGHGASDATNGEYTIEALAGDALAVADAAGAIRFHYLGVSLGGMIGLWLGAHARDRIDRLVLCNTAAQLPAGTWVERIAKVRSAGLSAIVDAVLQRWFTARFVARADESIASIRAGFIATDPLGYIGCCAAIRDMDLRDCPGAIQAPTLVITGTFDLATPKELGIAIADSIAQSARVELPVAHIPAIEAPGLFAHTVLQFLCGAAAASDHERFDLGLARRKQVLGSQYVDDRLARTTSFDAEFQDLVTRYAWGEMWTRDVLDDRVRRLVVLGMMIGLGRWEEFQLHVKAGLAADLSSIELREVLLLSAIYCGVPAANTGFHKAAELLDRDQ